MRERPFRKIVTSFDFANFEDGLESLERLGRCEKWKIDTLLKVGFVKYFESTGARQSSSWKFLGAVGHRNLGVNSPLNSV